MEFKEFCSYLGRLEQASGKIEKTKILAELFSKTDEIKETVSLSYGRLPEITGIAESTAIKAISSAFGYSENEVKKMFYEYGDLGIVAEKMAGKRRIKPLARKSFSVGEVYRKLVSLPEIEGKGSVERKMSEIVEILSHASPEEAKYAVRIVLSTMRLGVGDGIIRDALALAFSENAERIEKAFNVTGSYAEVAEHLRNGTIGNVRIEPFRPIRVMLAESGLPIEEITKRMGKPSAEIKYDGFRCQIHKKGKSVRLFTRNLEDVTDKFPDIVESALSLNGDFIIDSEAVAYRGKFLPFQVLSRRIQRKYDIDEMVRKIPVRVFAFDIIWKNGKDLTELPLEKRRQELSETVRENEKIVVATHVESGFEEFYKKCVSEGMEGIMIKDMESSYIPGKRVGLWYKVKPEKETLDVVITGAEHGEGRKGGLYTSFYVSVKSDTGFLEIGKVSSGFSDDELKQINQRIRDAVIEEGDVAVIRPEIVIEVMYQEIQRSPHYPSGFALRFPRFQRFRYDKSPEEADTIDRINRMFLKQRRR